jgi:uncharacterized protein (DUF4415 family)
MINGPKADSERDVRSKREPCHQVQRVGQLTKETMNKTEFITVRLPEDVMQKLRAEAKRNTRSLSAQVLHYIRLELDKKGAK